MSLLPAPKQYYWIWGIWLLVFYSLWLLWVWSNSLWSVIFEHWPIALAMALGSYVAGSTPMGGGSVGFPVLVLFFDMPASLGRDFSFAVQSVGMTSASIFILVRRQPLAWALLKGAMLGVLVGVPMGTFFFAPLIPELWVKVLFAVIWASFGLLHLYRLGEIAAHTGMTEFNEGWDFRLGLLLGLLAGSTMVSVTGVGIDMVVYASLVLLCRADLKIAIPTSVIIMAVASLIGTLVKFAFIGFSPGVMENWVAAAPVVALGAPLGVLIVGMIGRKPTLVFVALLCVGQFIWTCISEYNDLGWIGVAISLISVLCLLYLFEKLRGWGGVLASRERQKRHLSSLGVQEVEPHVGSFRDH